MASASVTSSSASATPASSPSASVSSASASSSLSLAPSPADLADERASESIRAALTSGEKAVLLDIAALRKTPDKFKKAFRTGIPMPQRKEAWSAALEYNTQPPPSDYLSTKLEVFNGHMHPSHFPHVPDFGSMMKWNENYIHLTHKRIQQAKAILCVLASTHATLTHCPCLPDFTCVLLIFFDERATFQLLERIIVRSKDDEFYFTTNGHDFLKWMKTFSILLEQKNEELHAHMHKVLKLDSGKVFQVWLSRFFIQYLPMRTVFRIVDSFLYEGNKILFRTALAILKVHTKVLLACKSSHAFLVKLHSVMSTQTPNELMAAGFDIYLSRSSHMLKIKEHLQEKRHSMLANPPASIRTSSFHLPRFTREHDHVSELVSLEQLYSLWSWLPPAARIQDPILLYSSSIHGYHYRTMWKRACEATVGESTPIFLLLQDSSNDQVIGLYLNRPLPNPPEIGSRRGSTKSLYTGAQGTNSSATTSSLPLDPQSFLFVLKPFQESYKHIILRQDEKVKAAEFKRKNEQVNLEENSKEKSDNAAHRRQPSTGGDRYETSEERAAFKPYGLPRILGENGDPIDIGRNPLLSISVDDAQGRRSSAAAIENFSALSDKLFAGHSNTVGHTQSGAHTPHPHKHSLGMPMTFDVAQSSMSLMVQPSRGVNKSQPLNELFGSLEMSPKPIRMQHAASESLAPPETLDAARHQAAILSGSPSVSPAHHADSLQPEHLGLPGPAMSPTIVVSPPDGSASSSSAAAPAAAASSPMSVPASAIALAPADPASAASLAPVRADLVTAAVSAVSIAAKAASELPPGLARHPSVSITHDNGQVEEVTPDQVMLLMTEDGFGIVETSGVVLYLSADLKSAISGPSSVFGSPNFHHYRGRKAEMAGSMFATPASSPATVRRGKFNISSLEMWSFASPGSEVMEAMSPRADEKAEAARLKLAAQQAEAELLATLLKKKEEANK